MRLRSESACFSMCVYTQSSMSASCLSSQYMRFSFQFFSLRIFLPVVYSNSNGVSGSRGFRSPASFQILQTVSNFHATLRFRSLSSFCSRLLISMACNDIPWILYRCCTDCVTQQMIRASCTEMGTRGQVRTSTFDHIMFLGKIEQELQVTSAHFAKVMRSEESGMNDEGPSFRAKRGQKTRIR